MQPGAHGADRDVEHSGHFAGVHLLDRGEQNDGAEFFRQAVDCGPEPFEVDAVGSLAGAVGHRLGASAVPGGVASELAAAGAAAVERQTEGDAADPGAELGEVTEAREAAVGAEESLLGDLFGVGRRSEERRVGKECRL